MNRHLEKFLSYLEIEKNYSTHTILNYRIDLEEFHKANADLPIDKVDYLQLRKYLAFMRNRNLKPRTMARKISTLRSFFKFLQREGFIKENPAVLLMTPKLDKRLPHFLSEQEVASLIECPKLEEVAGPRDRAILETLYSAGLRVSELVGLNVEHVDFISNLVRVMGKGKKERLVPIGNTALQAIKDYLDNRRHK